MADGVGLCRALEISPHWGSSGDHWNSGPDHFTTGMVLFGGVVAEIAQRTQAGAQWMATFRRKLRSPRRRNFSKGAIKL